MSCGTPVIAGNYGGTAESVIDGVTGILFKKQSVDSIVDAVKKFDVISHSIDYNAIRNQAEKFSRSNFETNIKNYVQDKIDIFNKSKMKQQK